MHPQVRRALGTEPQDPEGLVPVLTPLLLALTHSSLYAVYAAIMLGKLLCHLHSIMVNVAKLLAIKKFSRWPHLQEQSLLQLLLLNRSEYKERVKYILCCLINTRIKFLGIRTIYSTLKLSAMYAALEF